MNIKLMRRNKRLDKRLRNKFNLVQLDAKIRQRDSTSPDGRFWLQRLILQSQ